MKLNDVNQVTLLCYKPTMKERGVFFKKTIECLFPQEENTNPSLINYHTAVPIPHLDKIARFHRENIAKRINTKDTYYDKPSVFNCALNWYIIMKSLQGVPGIFMFLEDDCLIENRDYFNQILESAPDDFDILRFHYQNPDFNRMTKINEFWYKQEDSTHGKHCNCTFGCTACMIFKPKGIDFYCDFVEENGFLPADHPLMNTKDLNHYIHRSDVIKELSFGGLLKSSIQ